MKAGEVGLEDVENSTALDPIIISFLTRMENLQEKSVNFWQITATLDKERPVVITLRK